MKSRIVINKGFFINGTSWKVQQDGTGIHEIENAATAWKRDTSDPSDIGLAKYKEYDPDNPSGVGYHQWIKDESDADKVGYGNLIQFGLPIIPQDSQENVINDWVDNNLRSDMDKNIMIKVIVYLKYADIVQKI
jgi:hypothetical protein